MKEWEKFEEKKEKDQSALEKDMAASMMMCNQNHSKEIDIFERSFDEKIQIVKDFKQKGNTYFNEGDFSKASYFYAQALL